MSKVCCFVGHRYPWRNVGIEEKLYETIENLILDGYDVFYDGNYGHFDELSRKCVLQLRKKYPYVKLILILAYYHPNNKKYELPAYYNESIYPDLEDVYKKRIIIERNKWIVDNSDVIVSHITDFTSTGAYRTIKYAQKQNKQIIFIK